MQPEKLIILFLAANPDNADYLTLDEEVRAIDEAMRKSEYRDRFDLRSHWAVRVDDLQELLLRYKPHVVHFAGHGSEDGEIVLMDEDRNKHPVPIETFTSLFSSLKDDIRCVVLNACFTATQAQSLAQVVECVVGMTQRVSDNAARDFATGFYRGLVAGRSVAEAYRLGSNQIALAGRSLDGGAEDATPMLLAPRVDAEQVWLLAPSRVAHSSDFYRHISLPQKYVYRADLLADLKKALTNDTGTTVAIVSAAKMNAVHGMGGIGKTVAVRALCDDPDVQAAYPDGILWATVGQSPDLLLCMREWANALGASVAQSAPTIAELRNAVARVLQNKACLLIADDVWSSEHLAALQVGGIDCRLVITTRDAALAADAGATVQQVPLMAEAEAIALLEEWAGGSLADTAPAQKRQIVARLSYLPLAIRLAGAQLRTTTPSAWLASFKARKLQTRRPAGIHDSLEKTLRLSVETLDPAHQRLYASLAIFKDNEPIAGAAVAQLWWGLAQMDASTSISLLFDIVDRALLQRVADRDGDLRVIVHGLLREFMLDDADEAYRQLAHRSLLDGYRRTQAGSGWHTAPDDGYLYDHLAYHLAMVGHDVKAGVEELVSLFMSQDWMHARVRVNGQVYDGYLADLELAWANLSPTDLANAIRYSLVASSIYSLSGSYPSALIKQAVQTGLWSVDRALSVAVLVLDPAARVQTLLALVETGQCTNEHLTRLIHHFVTATLAIGNQRLCVEALTHLAARLPTTLQHEVQEPTLTAVLALDEASQAKELTAITPQLSGELLQKALKAVLDLSGERRAWALTALAPQFTGELLQRALKAVLELDEASQAKALTALAPQLSGELLQKALAAALAFEREDRRAWVLAALAPQLSGELLQQALAATFAIKDSYLRTETLTALAPRLSGELLQKALKAVLELDEASQAKALTALAPQLSTEMQRTAQEQALTAALAIKHLYRRVEALTTLAPHLSTELQRVSHEQALTAALAIKHLYRRVEALTTLAPHLSTEMQRTAQDQALKAVLELDEASQAKALTALAPQLSGELLQKALAAALAFERGDRRAWVLAALAPQLSGELLQQALAATFAIKDSYLRTETLTALAPRLSGELLQKALTDALAIKHLYRRVEALTTLAPQFTGELLQRALKAVLELDEASQAKALTALAPQLSGELLQKALAAALAFERESRRAWVLAALAPQLSGELLQQALAATFAIKDSYLRTETLTALAPRLSGELLQKALTDALTFEDEVSLTEALTALAPQLSTEMQQKPQVQKLAVAPAFKPADSSVETLMVLTPSPSVETERSIQEKALTAVLAFEDENSRAKALTALAPQLSGEMLQPALNAALAFKREDRRAESLTSLIPKLSDDLLNKVLIAAFEFERGYRCAWVLTALATRFKQVCLASQVTSAFVQLIDQYCHHSSRDVLLSVITDLADAEILALPFVDQPTLDAIASTMIDICTEWQWI